MPRDSIDGTCHLCGSYGRLTFEHVPPSAAYNDARVFEADVEHILAAQERIRPADAPGKFKQRGAGAYTLCADCNNDTGSWYGPEYVQFAKRLMGVALNVPTYRRANFWLEARPLPIMKQIATMFCSACPPEFGKAHPDLVRFLLNRDARGWPPDLSLYLALFDVRNSEAVRQSGISALSDFEIGKMDVVSEISFPPFNVVMSMKGRPSEDRLFDITWFSNYTYNEKALVAFELYSLPVNSPLPMDYRTSEAIDAEVARSVTGPPT
jgi:hypothetical protein